MFRSFWIDPNAGKRGADADAQTRRHPVAN
jgi:hypothetical protein